MLATQHSLKWLDAAFGCSLCFPFGAHAHVGKTVSPRGFRGLTAFASLSMAVSEGNSPYAKWFDRLNVAAAVKVTTTVHRMEQGNFSNVKGVGAGVYEYRIDFGPGYRIYFGKDGDRLVILLAGGTKKCQDADIAAAKGHWRDYKRRKRQEVT
ncbi:MAG: type II toxin-antitoxin system RelE/ParE family toxin [Sedimenticolaceae bacterium]